MARPFSEKTLVIHGGLATEELYVAYHDAEALDIGISGSLPQPVLDALLPKVKRVVVCGTHADTISPVLEVFGKCVALVGSEADLAAKKYGPRCEYKLLRGELSDSKHTWMQHIVRRAQPDEKEGDEAFYRGLLFHKADDDSLCDMFAKMLRQELNYGEIVEDGELIEEYISQSTVYQAGSAALPMRAGGRDALVLPGAWSPVLPVVKQLAAGGALGVVVRYNFATQCTHFTFYGGGSLDFVRESPYWGINSAEVGEATIAGMVPILAGYTLEECIGYNTVVSAA